MFNRNITRMCWVVVMFLLSLPSCGHPRSFNPKNYTQAVKSGFEKIPQALQIEQLFGEADHFISYSGPYVPQDWNTEVFFYGRYTLTMQVEVKTNSAFSEITEVVGTPKFFLVEVKELTEVLPDGTPLGARFSNDWRFGVNDWKKIYDAKGDFSVIGITIKKDQPIEGFGSFARGIKKLRFPVRPD